MQSAASNTFCDSKTEICEDDAANRYEKDFELPAPSITLGLLVFVQLVIAAMTTDPCLSL